MIFQSTRQFRIWVYTVSHNSLLLRSLMTYPEDENYTPEKASNIDIEITSVSYLNIPAKMNGVEIRMISKEECPNEIDDRLLEDDRQIIEFRSEGRNYYIIASGFIIAENRWGLDSRLDSYHMQLQHDKILYDGK